MFASSLTRTVSKAAADAVPALLRVLGGLPGSGTRTRRTWETPGGVQIEVHHLGTEGTTQATRDLEARLRDVEGVTRAEVNGTLGCVYVACDTAETDLERLAGLVAAADCEAAPGTAAGRPDQAGTGGREETASGRAAHRVGFPGAPENESGAAFWLASSVVATGIALAGRVARIPGVPPIVPTVIQLAESTPRVWEATARRIGAMSAGTAWWAAGMVTTTLTFRPLGPAGSALLAATRYTEVKARRRAWEDWAERTGRHEGAYRHDAAPAYERPAPLPPGPVERYANAAVPAALAAYGITGVLTRNHARGLAMLAAGTPRSPRLARECFAAAVGRAASARGALVLRPEALRRLDRIDTVVLDSRVLITDAWTIDELIPIGRPTPVVPVSVNGSKPDEPKPEGAVTGTPSSDEIHARIHELLHGAAPSKRQESAGWVLEPFTGHEAELPDDMTAQTAAWSERGAGVLLVSLRGQPVAVAGLVPELRPMAEPLVRAAREAGRVLLTGGPPGLHRRLGLEEAEPVGGTRTAALVRSLQLDGHGVTLVTTRTRRALVRADLGIGVTTRSGSVPWDADVVGTPDVAYLLLAALAEARALSRRCVRIDAVGSVVGSGLAFIAGKPVTVARARLINDCVALTGIGLGMWAGRALDRRPLPAAVEQTPWHAMTVRQVIARLGTSSRGLEGDEAARRRHFTGREQETRTVSLAGRVVEELANPLTPILAVGGGISAALGSLLDAVLIIGVLAVDALLGGVQRVKADQSAHQLLEATTPRVRLRRAGVVAEANADKLVAGDIVELRAGDAVPADCRVIRAEGLEVDESGLTGESQLVTKTSAPTAARAVADRHSMLYEGTTVAAGNALAVVVATGAATEMGSAAQAPTNGGPPMTGVERRLRALGSWFLPLSVASGVVLFLNELVRGRSLGAALAPAISLCVAAVPEGLPFVATVAELAAARRLSAHNTLVRSPSTIEALGRVDVLCFDKTGTLTEGRISLRLVSDGRERGALEALTPELRKILVAAVQAGPAGPVATLTHPTDRAIAIAAEHLGPAPDPETLEQEGSWQRLSELPFEPGRGYHAVLGRDSRGARLVVKGAPEVILAGCDQMWRNGVCWPFDAELQDEIHQEINRLARRGLRVLAIAERIVTEDELPISATGSPPKLDDSAVTGLRLLGLLGLADPVRPTAAESVSRLADAGVRIVMLTGDHPSTAAAIAEELHAVDGKRLMTGPELDALDDAALADALPNIAVFARVTPAHKVRIVSAFHAAGRVVAVTGDGANDAPAIRIADIGIAIGSRATPAARAAADVVVTDDRIETIVDAIVEGRAMWSSVRKALGILLGGNLGEIAFTLATSLLTGRSALNARQLLLVNLLTDMLPAMAIAARPPAGSAEKLLAEGPEASLGKALTRHIRLRAIATTGAATTAWIAARVTGTRARADTVALVALVASQLLQTLADAGRDPVVTLSALASLGVLVLVVTVPGLSHFFGSRPLGPMGWGIGLTAAAGSVLIPAAWRRFTVSSPNGHSPLISYSPPTSPAKASFREEARTSASSTPT